MARKASGKGCSVKARPLSKDRGEKQKPKDKGK